MIHPSEEHNLATASQTRILRSPTGEAIGRAPNVYPGTANERELLERIDEARWTGQRSPGSHAERQRRLRRHWASRLRHEA